MKNESIRVRGWGDTGDIGTVWHAISNIRYNVKSDMMLMVFPMTVLIGRLESC